MAWQLIPKHHYGVNESFLYALVMQAEDYLQGHCIGNLPSSEGDSSFAFWPRFPPLFLIIVSSLRCFFGAAAKTMLLTPIATMDGRAILVYSVSSHELLSLKRKEISVFRPI